MFVFVHACVRFTVCRERGAFETILLITLDLQRVRSALASMYDKSSNCLELALEWRAGF